MKLLFDENISFRIVKKVKEVFPESRGFDEDFSDLQSLKGFPSKIIWLRMGNSFTLNVLHKLPENIQAIHDLSDNPQLGILELY